MTASDEWTRRVLGVLRHDLTLVALAVAFVVLSAGVFAVANREDLVAQAESTRTAAQDADAQAVAGDGSWRAALFQTTDASAGVEPVLESSEAQAEPAAFVPELATDTPWVEPSLRVFEGRLERGETLS